MEVSRLGRWLWLPAVLVGGAGGAAAAGWLLLAGPAATARDLALSGALLVGPHVACAALTAWAGRRRVVPGLVGLTGSVLMTSLAWALRPRVQADDDVAGMVVLLCIISNSLILTVTTCVVMVLVAFAEPPAGGG